MESNLDGVSFVIKLNYMRYFMIMLACFGLLCCASEEDGKISYQLDGRWTLEKAERNGKETQTLKGAFFHFRPEEQLTTNIMGSEVRSDYVLKDDEILQKEPREIKYVIKQYKDSTMTLQTELRDTEFQFLLKRTSSN